MFKIGDIVIKARRYDRNSYCKHGGAEENVPIGTKGRIYEFYDTDSLYVVFANGQRWKVHAIEVDLLENYKFDWKTLLVKA